MLELTCPTWWVFGEFGEWICGSETSAHWFPPSLIDGKVDIPRGTGLKEMQQIGREITMQTRARDRGIFEFFTPTPPLSAAPLCNLSIFLGKGNAEPISFPGLLVTYLNYMYVCSAISSSWKFCTQGLSLHAKTFYNIGKITPFSPFSISKAVCAFFKVQLK